MDDNLYETMKKYALNSQNYKNWRKIHQNVFGNIFSSAFEENEEAQIHLTAALIAISQRNFKKAASMLKILDDICFCEFDRAAVDYFTGLNYEMLEKEKKMTERYEKLLSSSVKIEVNLSFRPYYRTAKFAQRNSECSKAIYYYLKSLEFFDNAEAAKQTAASSSQILYDIATVYMYMHEYDSAEHFLNLSVQCSNAENQHRDYVTAILYAIRGKEAESRALLGKLTRFLRENCEPMVNTVLAGTDPHYCTVPQNRKHYPAFTEWLAREREQFCEMVLTGNKSEAENAISEKLTETLPFMKRKLECRISKRGGKIIVKCKNYFVKSLISEYDVLFALLRPALPDFSFVSVNEFEQFQIKSTE